MASKSSQNRFQLLAGDRRVHDVADTCRAAALAFMTGTNAGWTRKDLAFWLVRDYADAVATTAKPSGRRKTVVPADRPLHETTIELLLLRTRERVLEMLSACVGSCETPALAHEMVESGLVIGVRDAIGAIGYTPVDSSELGLFDRVASLFVADYLTRPADYASIVPCEDCGEVSFAWAEVHCGECREHRVLESTIVPRNGAARRGVG